MTAYSKYLAAEKAIRDHWCWCCSARNPPGWQEEMIEWKSAHPDAADDDPDAPKTDWVDCDNCMRWYHPECLGTSLKDIASDRFTYAMWCCKFCTMQDVFVARYI